MSLKTPIIALTLAAITGFANAGIINVGSEADAWIAGSHRNNNYGSDVQLFVTDGTSASLDNAGRALFKFDLAGVESQINSAILTLTTGSVNSGSATFSFYRGTGTGSQDWIESEVKFDVYKTGSSWATDGGGWDKRRVVTKADLARVVTTFTVDVTTLVQDAVDASQAYITIFAFGDENSAYNLDSLYSKESPIPGYRPSLSIDSQVPEPVSAALLAVGGLMLLVRRRA